jgi:DNA primase
MAGATSISLSKFTASVQAAVTAAQKRNPKFALPPVQGITFSSVIRGIPVPLQLAQTLTMAEVQTFADDVAGQIGGAHPELVTTAAAVGSNSQGMVVSTGRHIICGIPPLPTVLLMEK